MTFHYVVNTNVIAKSSIGVVFKVITILPIK